MNWRPFFRSESENWDEVAIRPSLPSAADRQTQPGPAAAPPSRMRRRSGKAPKLGTMSTRSRFNLLLLEEGEFYLEVRRFLRSLPVFLQLD